MKKLILLLMIPVIFSCKDQRELERLKRENQKLKQEAEQQLKKDYSSKYVFAVINETHPFQYENDPFEDWEKNTIVSDIKLIVDYNDDAKYMFLDEFQSTVRSTIGVSRTWTVKILNRKCYEFDSYSEASIARQKFLK